MKAEAGAVRDLRRLLRLPPTVYLLVAFLVFAALPLAVGLYTLQLMSLIFMYLVLASGWNLVSGYLGELSFGHVAFFGVGAYTSAILSVYYGVGPPDSLVINTLMGGVAGGVLAALIGYPFLRMRGIYFAIGGLGLSEILRVVANNSEYLRTAEGFVVPFVKPYSIIPYYYVILVVSFATLFILYKVINSRLGYAFISIRDDMDAAKMVGINATLYRIICLVISGFFVGLAGGWFAQYNSYVYPNNAFSLDLTFEMLTMAIVGGTGTFVGPIVGVPVVYAFLEIGRATILRGYLILEALLLITVTLFVPGGIYGTVAKKAPVRNPFRLLMARWRR